MTFLGFVGVTFTSTFCVPFRSRHGFQIFQRVSDAVHHIMHRHGHKVINDVDDYLGFGVPSDARASFDLMFDLLREMITKNVITKSTWTPVYRVWGGGGGGGGGLAKPSVSSTSCLWVQKSEYCTPGDGKYTCCC